MTYDQVQEVKDWGPVISKLIINVGKQITAQAIGTDCFTVQVKRFDKRIAAAGQKANDTGLIEEGVITVKAIYASDRTGGKADKGSHITLELDYGPDYTLNSPLNYWEERNNWVDCHITITQKKNFAGISGLNCDKPGKTYRPQTEKFNIKGKISFPDPEFGKITLTYADYKPTGAHGNSKLPLIIWLHGLGSGGTDTSLVITSAKECHFASREIQSIFGGDAYVLMPQSPTRWMDTGKDETPDETGNEKANTSKYTRALKNLFDTYLKENPGIDTKRVYLGGLSNGGYMTQILIMDYPDYFAAALPVCSAALDSRISDEQLRGIRDLPIWFVNSAADTAVPAPKHSLATYDRLVKMGAPKVYYSYPRDVSDLSGRYKNKDGSPFLYDGHHSWIYVYNNALAQCIDGKETRILEWLSLQRRK